ncbi:Importin alpha [Entamoeba marina]
MNLREKSTLSTVSRERNKAYSLLRSKRRQEAMNVKRFQYDIPTTNKLDIPSPEQLPNIAEAIKQKQNVLYNLLTVRHLLVKHGKPVIDGIIDADLLTHLASFLYQDNCDIIVATLWIFTYISNTHAVYCYRLLKLDILGQLKLLSTSGVHNVRCQSLWVIGNIVGSDEELRNYMLNNEVVNTVILVLSSYGDDEDTIIQCAQVLLSLTRYGKLPYQIYLPIIKYMWVLPQYPADFIVALANLVGDKLCRKEVLSINGLVEVIISLLNNETLESSALFFLIKLSEQKLKYSKAFAKRDVLDMLCSVMKEKFNLLKDGRKVELDDYFFILSNIVLLGYDVIEFLMDRNIYIQVFLHHELLGSALEDSIYYLCHSIRYGNSEQKQYFCCNETFEVFTSLFKNPVEKEDLIELVLGESKELLEFGNEQEIDVVSILNETGFESVIIELCGHRKKAINLLAETINDIYLQNDESLD